jgi:hypothetical protein
MGVLVLSLAASVLGACGRGEPQEQPVVLDSASAKARWTVDLNRVLDGVFRSYRPRCIDSVRIGQTVEFRNWNPEISANVTSLAQPPDSATLFSPNLVRPYNYVGRDDPDNKLCEQGGPGGCTLKAHYSYFRYTFEVPGVYDWIDTNASTPGRKVVDPYYGTVTFVGIDPSSPFGTVCVRDEDGKGCESVCCTSDDDCEGGQRCFRTEVDAVGRCLTPSG